jgi:putative DNA primase/helicase
MRDHVDKLIREAEEIHPQPNGNGRLNDARKISSKPVSDRRRQLDLAIGRLVNLKRGGEDARLDYQAALRDAHDETSIPLKELEAEVARVLRKNGSAADQEAEIEEAEKAPARDEILAIGCEGELWRDADSVAYATVTRSGRRETWRVRSSAFRRYLIAEYRRRYGRLAGGQAMTDAIEGLEALAAEGPVHEPAVRVGSAGGKLYLDLGREEWEAVEIDAEGWRIVAAAPVKFLRPAALRPLPIPVKVTPAEGIAKLRKLVNFDDEADFRLLVAWLVAALSPFGPYPIMVATGEQGAAKSSLIRLARRMVDPGKLEAGSPPQSEEDLAVAAQNSHVQAFDNLSRLDAVFADGLCRLATGGGLRRRKRFTDDEETVIAVRRPLALNGIIEIGGRSDLADRALVFRLPPIGNHRRLTEKQLERQYQTAEPAILGALLSGVSQALAGHTDMAEKLAEKSRMADFEAWMAAAAPAFGWSADQVLHDYRKNRASVIERVIEADAIAGAIRQFVDKGRLTDRTVEEVGQWWTDGRLYRWAGSMTRLLDELASLVAEEIRRDRKSWPLDSTRLGHRITRAAPALRALGIDVRRVDGRHDGRVVEIRASMKMHEQN